MWVAARSVAMQQSERRETPPQPPFLDFFNADYFYGGADYDFCRFGRRGFAKAKIVTEDFQEFIRIVGAGGSFASAKNNTV